MTARDTATRPQARRLTIPAWVPTMLLAASAAVLPAAVAGLLLAASSAWAWLTGQAWLPGWVHLAVAGFAVGMLARAVQGWRTGWTFARSVWGSWRRRLRGMAG